MHFWSVTPLFKIIWWFVLTFRKKFKLLSLACSYCFQCVQSHLLPLALAIHVPSRFLAFVATLASTWNDFCCSVLPTSNWFAGLNWVPPPLRSFPGSCQLVLGILLHVFMVSHEFPVTAFSTLEFSGLLTVCTFFRLYSLPSRSPVLLFLHFLVQNIFYFLI